MSLARLAPLVVVAAGLATPVFAGAPIPLTFPSPPTGNVVQSNFLGLSIELSYLDVYFGNDTKSVPPQILTYLGALRNHTGSQPIRIRLGGNSMDSSTYVESQTSPMEVPNNPKANFNDVSVNFGPTLWDQMVAVGDGAGGSEYVVGLSLLDQNDPRFPDIPSMASSAKAALGNRLDTFLLGNEPDLYTGHQKRPQYANYTTDLYFTDFSIASGNLSNVNNPAILGGPTICCQWDLATVIQQGYITKFKNELKYISLQHYPQNYCAPPNFSYQLPYYGQHNQTTDLARWNAPGVLLALEAGIPVMMSEFNTASCGGIPSVSNTFLAGALWTLDYSMQLATVGFSTAYMHLREPGITYNPLQVVQGGWQTEPGYLALLIAPQVLGSGSPSRIIDLNIGNSMFDGTQQQAGYATYDQATNAISRLTLFNFADGHANMTFTIPKEVFDNSTSLKLPNANPSQVTVKYLTAASTSEEFDISWAGTTYKGVLNGKPVPDASGRPGVVTLDCSNGCSVDVPGPGMALVFVAPESVPATANGTTTNTTASASGTSGADSAPTTSTGADSKNNHADRAGPITLVAMLAASALGLVLSV